MVGRHWKLPYSLLFPKENLSQEYEQFPKVIDCVNLKKSACKSVILQELSTMNIASLNTVHDLIFITDFNTPNHAVFNTVSAVLDSLNIFWFQGSKDGRIYVTRDALLYLHGERVMCSDYLTKVNENKYVWNFKRLIVSRSKFIPLLLVIL